MINGKITIMSCHPFTSEQKNRLEKAIKCKHNENLEFEYVIDETMIGGFRIEDGFERYDATIKNKLSQVKRQMK